VSALRDPCHQSSPAMLDHLQPVHLLNILLSAVMLAMIPRSTDPQQRIARAVAFAGWGASIIANLVPLSVLALALSMIGGSAHVWAAFKRLEWLKSKR